MGISRGKDFDKVSLRAQYASAQISTARTLDMSISRLDISSAANSMQQPILPNRCLTGRVFKPSIFRSVRLRQSNRSSCLAMGRSHCPQTSPAHPIGRLNLYPMTNYSQRRLNGRTTSTTTLRSSLTPTRPTAACTAASTRCLVPKPTAPRAAPNAEC